MKTRYFTATSLDGFIADRRFVRGDVRPVHRDMVAAPVGGTFVEIRYAVERSGA